MTARVTGGARHGAAAYHTTGAAPGSPSPIAFECETGALATEIDTSSARSMLIKVKNASPLTSLTVSIRAKCHPSDSAYSEIASVTASANQTKFGEFCIFNGDAILGHSMQLWWSNQTGQGSDGSEVSFIIKG